MMAFNDYFGYQHTQQPQRLSRRSKRTELSIEKLGDVSDNSKSKKKHIVIPLIKTKTTKTNSPARSNRLSIKRSPFKGIEKKYPVHRQYGQKEKSQSKKVQQFNQTYQRYFSQDCKTKKVIVEKRKDSLIRQYFQRKKKQKLFQDQLEQRMGHKTQPNLILDYDNSKHFRKILQKNQYENHYRQNAFQDYYDDFNKFKQQDKTLKKDERSQEFSSSKAFEIDKISMESDNMFNEEEEDCVIQQNNEEISADFRIDDYQIKKSVSQIQKYRAYENQQQIKQENKPPLRSCKYPLGIEKKNYQISKSPTVAIIDKHCSSLGRLLQFIYETNQFYKHEAEKFQRLNYLLKRMYYEEVKKLLGNLKGNPNSADFQNCFVLSQLKLTKAEILKCKRENGNEINMKIKLLQKEQKQLKKMLQEQSEHLRGKCGDDPYIFLSQSNFEPELISQLWSEVNELTDKIKSRAFQKMHSLIEQRRYYVTCIIFLVAQLCSFLKGTVIPLESRSYKQHFQDNEQCLQQTIEKIQQMIPL